MFLIPMSMCAPGGRGNGKTCCRHIKSCRGYSEKSCVPFCHSITIGPPTCPLPDGVRYACTCDTRACSMQITQMWWLAPFVSFVFKDR